MHFSIYYTGLAVKLRKLRPSSIVEQLAELQSLHKTNNNDSNIQTGFTAGNRVYFCY